MTRKKDKTDTNQGLRDAGAPKTGKKRENSMQNMGAEITDTAITERGESAEFTAPLPRATHAGKLIIGDKPVSCAVLENGRRILSERSVIDALGGKRGGSHWERLKTFSDDTYKPVFISANNLRDFIPASLALALSQPIKYRGITGTAKTTNGVDATLLPEICEVWLKARRAGALLPTQKHIADNAEILLSGLAHIGIIALVDEATGYQEVRDRDELNRILAAYISKELLPWTQRFPVEFYQELFRLRGWSYRPLSTKRPRLVGKLTNELVYEKLPPRVLDELQNRNPVEESGRRRYKHHQFLTQDIGHPNLEKHLVAVITLMRVSTSWDAFKRLFDRAFPKPGEGAQLEAFDEES